MLEPAHRAAHVRRAARSTSTCGSTPRTRSRYGRLLGRPGPPHGQRVAARRRGAPAAHLQRHRCRGARERAGRRGAADRRAGRARRRRPDRASPAPSPQWTTWTGCGEPAWPRRSLAHAAPGRPLLGLCGGFQMLVARASTTRWRAGAARSPGWGCCRCEIGFQRDQDPVAPAPGRRSARPCAATRSITGRWSWRDPDLPGLITLPGGGGRGRGCGQRLRHALARRLRVRRVPAALPHPGGRDRRAARVRGRAGHRLRRAARRRPSTGSATWWRSTSTPTRCGG